MASALKNTQDRWLKSAPVQADLSNAKIDKDAGILRDVVLCQVGPAKGHGVELEQVFINEVAEYAQTHHKKGLKCRFGHPSLSDTTMGTQMAYFDNVRVRGTQAIGDLHLLEAAKNAKGGQNIWEWMFDMAEEKPDFVMMSIVFRQLHQYQYDADGNYQIYWGYDEKGNWIENEKIQDQPVYVALSKLFYCDAVEEGAATDNLFSPDNIGAALNADKLAIIGGRFASEQPELVQFLQKNPHKLIEFSKHLGIDLVQKKSFTGFISELFQAKKTDIEAFKAQFKTEIEEDIKKELADGFNSQIAEMENQFEKAKSKLQEQITEKETAIEELKKLPIGTHTNFKSLENPTPMAQSNGKTIFNSKINQRAVDQYNRLASARGVEKIDKETAFAGSAYVDDANTYQDHVKQFREDILIRALESFRTFNAVTVVPAVKGKMVITEQVVEDIVNKWQALTPDSDGTAGTNIKLKAHELTSVRLQFHEKITPAELENTYLAELRSTGQNPQDFPFEMYVMEGIIKKIASFNEKAFWRAVATGGQDAGDKQFDGILHQIEDAVTATDLTETTIDLTWVVRKSQDQTLGAGEIGTTEAVETMIQSAPDALLDSEDGLAVFMRRKYGTNYQLESRNLHGATPQEPFEPFNVAGLNATAYPLAGINNHRVLITPAWNICYGYDAETDIEEFNTQYILNTLHIFGSFRIAAKLLIADDTTCVVNNIA